MIAPLLSKAFNREYEWGEKDMEEYGREMRKVLEKEENLQKKL